MCIFLFLILVLKSYGPLIICIFMYKFFLQNMQ